MIYDQGQQQQAGTSEYADDETKDSNYSSSPRIPRVVRSLVRGSVLQSERSKTPAEVFQDNESPVSNSSMNGCVVIDSKCRSIMARSDGMATSKLGTRVSSKSLLASIGVCAGVGPSPFLNEHNEETRFEYRFDNVNCNSDVDDCDGRQLYNCYGSPQSNHGDEQKTEEQIVRFSSADLPLGQATTCTTNDSTNHSMVNVRNLGDSNVVVESLGGGRVNMNADTTPHDAFTSARRLLFGQEETNDAQKSTGKQSSSFRCNKHDYILCTTKKRNYCLNETYNTTTSGIDGDDDDQNNGNFLQWNNQSTSASPNPNGSPDRSSVSKTIYAAAYGDELIGDNPGTFRENDKSHREIRYWKQRLHHASKYYGKAHASTADAYFNLGRAQMHLSPNNSRQNQDEFFDPYGMPHPREAASQQKHRYDLAIENLTIARQIWERKHGSEHLAVGRAIDSLAFAIVKRANHDRAKKSASATTVKDDLLYARRLYEQAFSIRVHHLGVWHVDTVETFNRLAGVLLHLGQLKEACRAYHEVFLVRRAIFGNNHASVAISAHSLANCYYKMGVVKEALKWYSASLDVYERMGLSYRHPAVTQLLKDQSRLEEYMDFEV